MAPIYFSSKPCFGTITAKKGHFLTPEVVFVSPEGHKCEYVVVQQHRTWMGIFEPKQNAVLIPRAASISQWKHSSATALCVIKEVRYRDHFWGHHLGFLSHKFRKLLSCPNNTKIILFFSKFGQKPSCAAIFTPKNRKASIKWNLVVILRGPLTFCGQYFSKYNIWSNFGPNWVFLA